MSTLTKDTNNIHNKIKSIPIVFSSSEEYNSFTTWINHIISVLNTYK